MTRGMAGGGDTWLDTVLRIATGISVVVLGFVAASLTTESSQACFALVYGLVAVAGIVVACRMRGARGLRAVGVSLRVVPFRPADLAIGLGYGIPALLTGITVGRRFDFPDSEVDRQALELILVNPIVEEVVFRGYALLGDAAAPGWSRANWARWSASSAVFATMHLIGMEGVEFIDQSSVFATMFLFGLTQCAGVGVLGWSLWRTIACHSAYGALGLFLWTDVRWVSTSWCLGVLLSQALALTLGMRFRRRRADNQRV